MFKARRLLYHSTPGLRVIKKKKKKTEEEPERAPVPTIAALIRTPPPKNPQT